jgi:hypothetical protein
MADTSETEGTTLCLSGGGLRATYFHLGVIWALRQRGDLKKVKKVYSVSGGSVAAAHLALNWSNYAGTSDADAMTAAKELVHFARRDVWVILRNRIVVAIRVTVEALRVRQRLSPRVTQEYWVFTQELPSRGVLVARLHQRMDNTCIDFKEVSSADGGGHPKNFNMPKSCSVRVARCPLRPESSQIAAWQLKRQVAATRHMLIKAFWTICRAERCSTVSEHLKADIFDAIYFLAQTASRDVT